MGVKSLNNTVRMMLPTEIRKEAKKYASGDATKLEAFIAGAMFATSGKYYKDSNLFDDECT